MVRALEKLNLALHPSRPQRLDMVRDFIAGWVSVADVGERGGETAGVYGMRGRGVDGRERISIP